MAAMQNIEAPIGENKIFAFCDKPVAFDAHLGDGQYFRLWNCHAFFSLRNRDGAQPMLVQLH
jgi:hypothetical protein